MPEINIEEAEKDYLGGLIEDYKGTRKDLEEVLKRTQMLDEQVQKLKDQRRKLVQRINELNGYLAHSQMTINDYERRLREKHEVPEDFVYSAPGTFTPPSAQEDAPFQLPDSSSSDIEPEEIVELEEEGD